MKSIQMTEHGAPLEAAERVTPEPTGTEVLVKIDACGVCHSDVHLWEGYFDLGGGRKADTTSGQELPFTLGHEIVGTVAALGPKAAGVSVGDRRVAYPWIGCGDCAECKAGDEHLCARPRALGVNVDGGYSDHVMVPHERYLFDYGDAPASLACTYACSGVTSYAALMKVKARAEGRTLLLVGAGGVGLAGLTIAQAVMKTEIIVADIDPDKLEAAKAAGADHVIDSREKDARRQIMGLTGGGPAAVVDFVGNDATAALAVGAVAKGGIVVVVGLMGGALSLSLPLLPLKNMTLAGSYVGSLKDMDALMALVRAGKVKPLPVTPRPLDTVSDTLTELRDGKVVGRVVVEP